MKVNAFWVMLTVLILILYNAEAYYMRGENFEAAASYHSPILFIPGIMGSVLEDYN